MSPVLLAVNTALILTVESQRLSLLIILMFVPSWTEHVVEVHEACSIKENKLANDICVETLN